MRITSTLLALSSTASAFLQARQASYNVTSTPNVAAAQYDGTCFYPVPDPKFNLNAYLGTWYQVAGTPFGPTAGARCVTANYQLNVRSSEPLVETLNTNIDLRTTVLLG
jgi:apolipoprotein D and lipocalin family protein